MMSEVVQDSSNVKKEEIFHGICGDTFIYILEDSQPAYVLIYTTLTNLLVTPQEATLCFLKNEIDIQIKFTFNKSHENHTFINMYLQMVLNI